MTTNTVNRYTINGLIGTADTVMDNLEKICAAAGCWLTYDIHQGAWAVIINKPGNVEVDGTRSFNDSNIIGSISISTTGIDGLYNSVNVTFPHEDLFNQPDVIQVSIPLADRFPNEPDNTLELTYGLVSDPVQAMLLGAMELRQSRVDKIIKFQTDFSKINVKAGDLIDVTNSVYGFNKKVFRVITVSEADTTDGDINIIITALEYDANVYDEADLSRDFRFTENGIYSGVATPLSETSTAVTNVAADVLLLGNDVNYQQGLVDDITASVVVLSSDVTTLSSDVSGLDNDVTVLQGNVTTINQAIVLLASNVASSNANLAAVNANIALLESNVVLTQGNLDALNSYITMMTNTNNATIAAINLNLNQLNSNVATLTSTTAPTLQYVSLRWGTSSSDIMDTRAWVVTPMTESIALGWTGSDAVAQQTYSTYFRWGGHNTYTENYLLDVDAYKALYPSATSVNILMSAKWRRSTAPTTYYNCNMYFSSVFGDGTTSYTWNSSSPESSGRNLYTITNPGSILNYNRSNPVSAYSLVSTGTYTQVVSATIDLNTGTITFNAI
jgi:hypothetical protein